MRGVRGVIGVRGVLEGGGRDERGGVYYTHTLNYTILHYTFGFFCVWCNLV